MAVSKLTCPQCKTVLRPAKPVPEDKKAKCPKCGHVFTAGEGARAGADPDVIALLDEDLPPKPAVDLAPARQAAKRPARKAAPGKPPAKAAKKDEEDDGPATYGYAGDDTDDDDKPDINYAPDTSIKDLRGPAQEAIVRPSNWLMRIGVAGFIGYLIMMILIMIPVFFPLKEDENRPERPALPIGVGLAAMRPGAGVGPPGGPPPPGLPGGVPGGGAAELPPENERAEADNKSFLTVLGVDLGYYGVVVILFVMMMAACVVGMIYCAVLTYGGVQLQNMESRGWGIAASVMAMLPIPVFALQLFVAFIIEVVFGLVIDDPDYIRMVASVFMGFLWVGSLAVGVWNLKTCLSEDVVAGFEYVAE